MFWLLESLLSSPFSIFLAGLLVLVTWHYWFMLREKVGLPAGPVSLPLIGSMYVFFGKHFTEMPFIMSNLAKKYGGICTMQFSNGKCLIILTDMKSIRETFGRPEVAGRPSEIFSMSFKIINPYYPKQGILFSDYDEELKQQKQASMKVLRELGYGKRSIETRITEEVETLKEEFKKFDGKSFSPKRLLELSVTNIIVSLLFGERYDYDDDEVLSRHAALERSFEVTISTRLNEFVWFYKYLPSTRRTKKELKNIGAVVNEFIYMRIQETREKIRNGETSEDFISGYLKEVENANGKLDDRSFQLVTDFFAAGSETTTTTLGWVIYFMAKYPKVQEKVREELNTVLGKGRLAKLTDRESLHYLNATLIEVMRVAPTAVGSLPHCTIADTEIAGYKVPKGTEVTALFLNTLWDPKAFPDPHVLKPERHLDSNGHFVRNENIVPFGIGKRSCFGELLARQELFLYFAHLIPSFEFKVPEGEPLPPQKGNFFITYQAPLYNICAVPLQQI